MNFSSASKCNKSCLVTVQIAYILNIYSNKEMSLRLIINKICKLKTHQHSNENVNDPNFTETKKK